VKRRKAENRRRESRMVTGRTVSEADSDWEDSITACCMCMHFMARRHRFSKDVVFFLDPNVDY